MGMTRAQQNRKIQQDALRERLAAGGHLDHVIDITDKLHKLSNDLDALQIQRLRAAADIKMKLVAKYLPDLKAIEITGEGGGPVRVTATEQDEQI